MHVHHLEIANLAWFLGWLVALAVLFWLALRLPLQTRLPRLAAQLYTAGVVVAIFAVAVLANLALALHDVHFDLTREKVFTPSAEAQAIVDRLERPVKLTYFFQGQDPNGRRAADILETMARRNPLLELRAVDPDKEPTLAETAGVKVYNAAVLEAGARRIMVRSTDEAEIAIGIQRVLRERVVNVCFIEGHGEYPIDNFEFHTHFEGGAGHSHDDAASALVLTEAHGFGRLRRALEGIGYDVRAIAPASAGAIPQDCTVVVDAGPRTTYLPAESAAIEAYLRGGGSALLMYDLGFALEPDLARLMATLGVAFPQAAILDPKSHYATDEEMVAVTAYQRHPITHNVSLTFYPGVRPLELLTPADGIEVVPLVESSSDSHTVAVEAVAERQPGRQPVGYQLAADAAPRTHVLAAAIDGTLAGGDGPFRAIVTGDSDFASNSFLPYMANSDLALAAIRWLAREEQAVPIASRIPAPALILLTNAQMRGIFLVIVVLLPLLVLAAGGLVLWQRR